MDDTNLNELFGSLEKYEDGDIWDRFLQQEFFRYPRDFRVSVMTGFDRLMSQEIRPNRTAAMWLNRAREMESMHRTLERGGR